MTDTKQMQNHLGVTSSMITIQDLFSIVLKEHVVVASSESAFLEAEVGLHLSVLTIWVKLTPQSIGFAFFQRQLAEAVAFWDSAYAERLKESPGTGLPEHENAMEPFWAHPPQEPILLVFDGTQHVQSSPVSDFLYNLINHPLESTAILLLRPTNAAREMQMDPEEVRELEQAADWIAQGDLGELEAFFVQQGIRYTSPELTRQYLQLLRHITDEQLGSSPVLQIIQANMLSISGQVETAHYVLRQAGSRLESEEPSAEQRWALGEIYLLQALLNMSLGNSSFLSLLKKADSLLPDGSKLITRHTGMCLGNSNAMIYPGFEKQDVHRILKAMHEANPYVLRLTNGFGHGRHYLASAEVYYYSDQFRKAKSNVQIGISRAREYQQWDLQCNAHCLLMRIAIAQGDYPGAIRHIGKMKECRLQYGAKEQRNLFLPELAEAEFYLKIGEGQRVAPWLLEETRPDYFEYPIFTGCTPIIRTSCLMESGKLLEALDTAEKALQQFSKYKQFMLSLQAYIQKAVLYSRIGELDMAVMHLRLAYEMGAPNDLIMMFAEYGRHMATLMERVRGVKGHDIPHEWLDRLQSRSEAYSRNVGHLRTTFLAIETRDTTPGHLTRREQEAMELLCEGLNNQQIADRMGIKQTSLRTSLYRIYGKLGAENRTDAVRLWQISKK